jgi:hypothetical protein
MLRSGRYSAAYKVRDEPLKRLAVARWIRLEVDQEHLGVRELLRKLAFSVRDGSTSSTAGTT